ncbi:MAG: hypothetical protein R3B55_00300 [Candidatus Paceibacterota bacterium]
MNKQQFLSAVGLEQPLLSVHGDIFETPADHIAFAVNFAGKSSKPVNSGGFAGEVSRRYWPEISNHEFQAGVPVSRYIASAGKFFHALPVHSNEEGGWKDAPELITKCFNLLPVPSTEVIATVLMGAGSSGTKYNASPRNIEAMALSYKEIVLYIYEEAVYHLLLQTGLLASPRREVVSLKPKMAGVKVLGDFPLQGRKQLELVS